MLGEIAQLRDTAVPRHHVPWTNVSNFRQFPFLSSPPPPHDFFRDTLMCVFVCECVGVGMFVYIIVYRSGLSATPGTFQGRKGSRSFRPETYPSSSVGYHISPILLRSVARIYGT